MDCRAEVNEAGVLVTATGISGHSAYPEGKRSAIGMMLKLLAAMGAKGGIETLAKAVGLESDGAGLGCACADEISGALTNNMGILRLENGEWFGTLDRGSGKAEGGLRRASAGNRCPGKRPEAAASRAGGQRAGAQPAGRL